MYLLKVVSDLPIFGLQFGNDFDPKLQQITGNVLEAIKYVFDIRDCQNMQDYVQPEFLQEAAKGNVSLIFVNEKTKKRKLTKLTRQFDVAGTHQYFINDKEMSTEMVQDFCSKNKLTVKNPQQFIVTKEQLKQVLNMQPNELLKMVEEAAAPALLKEKGALYADFAQICRELNWVAGTDKCSMYMQLCQGLQSFKNIELGIAQLSCAQAENIARLEHIESAVHEIERQLKEQLLVQLRKLEHELAARRGLEISALCSLRAAQDTSQTQSWRMGFRNYMEEERYLFEQKEELAKLQRGEYKRLHDAYMHDTQAYEQATRKLDAMCRGLVIDENGKAVCLYDKLLSAKNELAQARTEIKRRQRRITWYTQRANSLQISAEDHAEYVEQRAHIEHLQDEIVQLKSCLKADHLEQLNAHIELLNAQICALKDQLASSNEKIYNLEYSDPKYYGMAGKLFSLRKMEDAAALMIAGGAKLFCFVTDDPSTYGSISQLGRHITCIPMSGMNENCMLDQRIIEYAQQKYGKQMVFSPLDLINFEPYFEQLMRFVFGKTLMCSDMFVAQQVANDPEIMCRSVTLDGWVFEPTDYQPDDDGLTTPPIDNLFEDLEHIKQIKTQLAAKKFQLEQLEQAKSVYESNKTMLELRQVELSCSQRTLAATSYVMDTAELKVIHKQLKTERKRYAKARRWEKICLPAVEQVTAKLAHYNSNHDYLLQAARLEVQLTRQSAEISSRNFMPLKGQAQMLQLTIKHTKKAMRSSKSQIDQGRENYEQLVKDLQEQSLRASDAVAALEHALKRCQKSLRLHQEQQTKLLNEKDILIKQNMEIELQLKIKQIAKNKAAAAIEKSCVLKKLDKFRVQAWRKVNRNFVAIIYGLLPRVWLSLTAVRTDGFISGLHFGEAEQLGNAHKPLVALAFMLAILKCTPATLYILDELDAALDVCETQNIAKTFKKLFGDSQFLVRSMHDDANAKPQ